MKVYIAYDHERNPTGVLLSESQEKAEITWSALGTDMYNVEEIDPNTVQGIHGVVFLLTSTKCNSRRDYSHRSGGVDFYQWKRGN